MSPTTHHIDHEGYPWYKIEATVSSIDVQKYENQSKKGKVCFINFEGAYEDFTLSVFEKHKCYQEVIDSADLVPFRADIKGIRLTEEHNNLENVKDPVDLSTNLYEQS